VSRPNRTDGGSTRVRHGSALRKASALSPAGRTARTMDPSAAGSHRADSSPETPAKLRTAFLRTPARQCPGRARAHRPRRDTAQRGKHRRAGIGVANGVTTRHGSLPARRPVSASTRSPHARGRRQGLRHHRGVRAALHHTRAADDHGCPHTVGSSTLLPVNPGTQSRVHRTSRHQHHNPGTSRVSVRHTRAHPLNRRMRVLHMLLATGDVPVARN